jgi:hypothetical protein
MKGLVVGVNCATSATSFIKPASFFLSSVKQAEDFLPRQLSARQPKAVSALPNWLGGSSFTNVKPLSMKSPAVKQTQHNDRVSAHGRRQGQVPIQ